MERNKFTKGSPNKILLRCLLQSTPELNNLKTYTSGDEIYIKKMWTIQFTIYEVPTNSNNFLQIQPNSRERFTISEHGAHC